MTASAPAAGRSLVRLELLGISKRFGALRALDGVRLDLRGGEIHGLLGENGAGKTTLMNVAYGLTQPDRGAIRIDGEPVRLRSAQDARRHGVGMVHQHFTVVDRLTTVENLALGMTTPGLRLRRGAVAAEGRALARRIGLEIGDPYARAGTLAVGARQRLEILKALAGDTRVLILDEPTAVLTPQEVEQLFAVLRRLRGEGRLVVFITHKLREVRAVADRVSVLRRGAVAGTAAIGEVSDRELAVMMVGAALPPFGRAGRPGAREALRLEGVRLSATAPRGVDLRVRAGEVFGIVGVDGNGQTELFEVLAGLRAPWGGRVCVAGREVAAFSPAALQAAGVGCIPPDRRHDGLVGAMTVAENLLLGRPLLDRFSRRGMLREGPARRFAEEQAARYRLRAAALDAPAAALSGGNQQRVVVARALAARPEVLVAVNPTRGLDIAAARAVYDALGAFVAGGKSVILISTDLDEALEMSDRVAVLFRHQLSAPAGPPYAADHIGLMMAGAAEASCA